MMSGCRVNSASVASTPAQAKIRKNEKTKGSEPIETGAAITILKSYGMQRSLTNDVLVSRGREKSDHDQSLIGSCE